MRHRTGRMIAWLCVAGLLLAALAPSVAAAPESGDGTQVVNTSVGSGPTSAGGGSDRVPPRAGRDEGNGRGNGNGNGRGEGEDKGRAGCARAANCPDPPSPSATPELSSVLLFGGGLAGLGGFVLQRRRRRRAAADGASGARSA